MQMSPSIIPHTLNTLTQSHYTHTHKLLQYHRGSEIAERVKERDRDRQRAKRVRARQRAKRVRETEREKEKERETES